MPLSIKPLSASGLFVRWLPLLAFCAVITHYFWLLNSHAINIPYQDDIYDFLGFVSSVESADSARDALNALFTQYNDHRTSASRLLVFGVYLAEGELNFHTLTLFANLALPLILLLFYLTVREEKYRWVYLLVAALLLINLRYYEIILFSQAAFAYYYVFLYAFACIFTLHNVSWPKFVLAVVFCTLSSLTMASGQIVWLLGLVSLLHQSLMSGRRQLMWSAMWFLVAVVMLMVWRVGFTEVSTGPILLGLPDQLIDPPPPFYLAVARYAAWFFAILGCAFIDSSALGAGVVGIIMVALLSFITFRFHKHDDIRLALYCWFVVGFAAAVTVGRALLLAPDYVLGTRYSFLSVMLMSTLSLLVQVRFALFRTSVVFLVVVLAGMYWGWANYHFEKPLQNYMHARHLEFNREIFPVVLRPAGESDAVVNKAISAGIYNPPCRPFPKCEMLPTRGE